MNDADIADMLRSSIPADRIGSLSVEIVSVADGPDGVVATVRMITYDGDSLRDVKESDVSLGELDEMEARFVGGRVWENLEALDGASEETICDVMPKDLFAPPDEDGSDDERRETEETEYAYERAETVSVDAAEPPPASERPGPVDWTPEDDAAEPEAVVSREEALSRLESADTSPIDALRSLAREPDPAIADRLKSRLTSLDDEDFSTEGSRFGADLACALLPFAQREDWLALLRRSLFAPAFRVDAVRGLATLDGNTIPFADNPWDVAPSATISEALETVWEPIRDRLAGAVPWLFARTVAVALLEGEDGELRMTYLFLRERDRYVLEDRGLEGRVPTAVAPNELHRWVGVATLDTLVAAPPSSATETQLEDGRSFPLPLALRELHRRHGCIDSGISSIGDGLGSLQKFFADNPDPIRDVNDGAHPRRFVEFGSDGTGNAFVFDLDRLDSRGDPLVAFWDHESRRVGERHPFWVYVDRRLRTMLGIDRS